MKAFRILPILLLAVLLLSGCNPEERFWWAPNGQHAVVQIKERLVLTDAKGTILTDLVAAIDDELIVQTVEWLPNSAELLVLQIQTEPDWDTLRAKLPEDEVAHIEALANAVVAVGLESPALEILFQDYGSEHPLLAYNAQFRAWQLLGRPEDVLDEDEQLFAYHELVKFSLPIGGSVLVTEPLAHSAGFGSKLRVSPTHPVVALLRTDPEVGAQHLELHSLDGGEQGTIAHDVLPSFEWTPDGRSLVFMTALGGEDSLLKQVQRVEAIDSKGALHLGETTPDAQDLATALIPFEQRVQVLPDGRVLFAAQPTQFPTASMEPEAGPQLYLLSPEESSLKPVPVAKGGLPTNLGYFVASPDGKQVAIVESDTDALAVIDLETGKLELVSEPHTNWECRTMPAWRTNTELTYAEVNPKSKAVSWMIWSPGKGKQALNKTWPDGSTKGWVEYDDPNKN